MFHKVQTSDVPLPSTGTGAEAPTGAKRGTGAKNRFFPGIFHWILWKKVVFRRSCIKNHKN